MGSESAAPSQKDEAPVHEVTISHDLLFGKYEVTESQWDEVEGADDPTSSELPAVRVTWLRALRFANNASRKAHAPECYDLRNPRMPVFKGVDCAGFRLPTEAEWEFAARSGLADDPTVTKKGPGTTAHPERKPPGNHIVDLFGNVSEWVWDFYDTYQPGPALDPVGPSTGAKGRVYRGCSARDLTRCSASRRGARASEREYDDIGFRLVRTVSPVPGPPPALPLTSSGRDTGKPSADPRDGCSGQQYVVYQGIERGAVDGTITLLPGRKMSFKARTTNLELAWDLKLFEAALSDADKTLQLTSVAPPHTSERFTLTGWFSAPQLKCIRP